MPTFASKTSDLEEATALDMLRDPDQPEQVQLQVLHSRALAATVLTEVEVELLFPLRTTPRVG